MSTTTSRNTTEVQFGDLPAATVRGRRLGYWPKVAEELKARAGEWAKVDTADKSTSAHNMRSAIVRGRLAGMVRGEFEATVRGLDVWARYVGTDAEQAS